MEMYILSVFCSTKQTVVLYELCFFANGIPFN